MSRFLEVGNKQSQLPKHRPTLQTDLVCSIEQTHYILPYMYIRIGSTEVEHISYLTYWYQFIILKVI